MSTSPLSHKNLAVLVSALALAACNGSSTTSTPSTGITLTGQAVTSGTPQPPASVQATGRVTAAATTVRPAGVALTGGTVELYKIFPDGVETQVDIGTVTTDSSGDYAIPDVPVAETGSGAGTDFYYEVRISDDTTGTDLRAPVAPGADTVVGVSPATNLAAHILTDVAEVPGNADLPTPSAELIESMRKLTSEDADKLDSDDSATIPEATTAGVADVIASANGLASAGGDAEKLYKAVQFESELLAVTTGGTATSADAGAYIKRVTREGDDQISTGNALPAIAADAMGQALLDGTLFTPREIVAAYNTNNGNITDVDETVKVAQFAKMLGGVQDKFDDSFDTSTDAPPDMDNDSQVALYTKRDLSSVDFALDTPLDADQAIAFLQILPKVEGNPGTKVGGFSSDVDVTAIVDDLLPLADTSLDTPAISDVQIYHNSGFGCNQGSGDGHFVADVDVYAPLLTVTGATITSSDTTALGGDGTENLIASGKRWMSDPNQNGICVKLDTAATYTVAATLSNSTIVTTSVTRTHPLIPEATTTVGGVPASGTMSSPDVLTEKRPVYSWTTSPPVANPPAGSQVKYTYEFSHIDITANPVGPLSMCNSVNSSGNLAMYTVDNFMPTVDCDVAACASASGVAASNIACRINIQTFLVDEYDRLLGQSAGNFKYFCVDLNADGSCG